MKDIISIITLQSVFIWFILSVFVGVVAYVIFRNDKIKLLTLVSLPMIAFYLSFVFTITIFSRVPSRNAQYNYLLFWTYRAILDGNYNLISEIAWNIILFIPISVLLMLAISYKNKVFIAIVSGFLMSSLIEVIQLVSHRGLFEFDDIVHNTLGATIGVCVYLLVSLIVKRFKSKQSN